MEQNYWRKCIVCKREINFSTKYFKCSVTSCDKKRSPAQFCSVDCWDVHRSIMSHKSAGADEYHSPTKSEWEVQSREQQKVKLVSAKTKRVEPLRTNQNSNHDEILVVVSKLKQFVKDVSGLNTSADVMPIISDIIRRESERAIQSARREGRKTLMAKDFK